MSSAHFDDDAAPPKRAASGVKWQYITPLIFTALPLIRLTVSHAPLRNRLYGGVIAVALVHGVTLMAKSTEARRDDEEVFLPPPPRRAPA